MARGAEFDPASTLASSSNPTSKNRPRQEYYSSWLTRFHSPNRVEFAGWKQNSLFFFFSPPYLLARWSTNTSAVLPEVAADSTGGGGGDDVVYIVGVLRSATPGSCPPGCLHDLLRRNRRITEAAVGGQVGAKQYMPHHQTAMQWRQHFGRGWERFAARKARFDPLNILAPGQGIFPRISDSIPRTTTRSPLLLHSSQ